MEILDLHTHHPFPQPNGIIAIRLRPDSPVPQLNPGQAYSIGIHPWDTGEEIPRELWQILEEYAALPQIVAIGECGIDLTGKGAPLFRQLQVFRRQAELARSLGKPLVIHNVKGDDIVLSLHKELNPAQPWAIHGFRGNPKRAAALLRRGLWLSLGAVFNSNAISEIPRDRILAETDESPLSITEVIEGLHAARNDIDAQLIDENTNAFLNS